LRYALDFDEICTERKRSFGRRPFGRSGVGENGREQPKHGDREHEHHFLLLYFFEMYTRALNTSFSTARAGESALHRALV